MLNRRHLRIKVLQALYAFLQSDNDNLAAGQKELFHSIDKMYDMYIYFLQIFQELPRFEEIRIEEAKRKRVPTKEDLAPNMKFVNNRLIKQLAANKHLQDLSEDHRINWLGDIEQDMLKKMYQYIRTTEIYQEYMESSENSYEEDKAFIVKLFKKEVCNFNLLHHFFEERSIYWQDDMDHICSMVIKTLKQFNQNTDEYHRVFDQYKDDEEEYAKTLFRRALTNEKEHEEIISKYTKNWESERLAKMDMLLMNLAITEAIEFRSIPLKVSLNEYIEISKFYSTPKSNGFINGVLDKVFEDLKNDGTIKKVGRGLIE